MESRTVNRNAVCMPLQFWYARAFVVQRHLQTFPEINVACMLLHDVGTPLRRTVRSQCVCVRDTLSTSRNGNWMFDSLCNDNSDGNAGGVVISLSCLIDLIGGVVRPFQMKK